MGNLVAQLFVGSDGKLHKKKKGVASKPSRTRRLIKTITVIKRFDPSFNAHGFAVQRVQLKPANLPRRTWLNEMLRDLLALKRDTIAQAKARGIKPLRLKAPEKKALRKELMHFRAEILGKVSNAVAGPVASKDSVKLKRARAQIQKQYPGLRKRNKVRFDDMVQSAYNMMIESSVGEFDPSITLGGTASPEDKVKALAMLMGLSEGPHGVTRQGMGKPVFLYTDGEHLKLEGKLGKSSKGYMLFPKPGNVDEFLQFSVDDIQQLDVPSRTIIIRSNTIAASVGAPNLEIWQQALTQASRDLGQDHPRVWMHARELYKKAGGEEVPGLNARVGDGVNDQLAKGTEVEYEGHGDTLQSIMETAIAQYDIWQKHGTPEPKRDWDLLIRQAAEKFAQDHIHEIRDYYDRLEKMEDEANLANANRLNLHPVLQNLRQRAKEDLKPIKLSPGFRTIDIDKDNVHALAAMADRDEQRIRVAGQVAAESDEPWFEDEWKG